MEVKWIKLNTDMFDNSKIKYIRTLPSGNDIVLIWVMLLTKAGKCNSNGYIFLTESIPYSPEMLGAELGFETSLIILALTTFQKLNMIQLEEQKIYVNGWLEHQNIDGLDKIREQTRNRVARFREKKKLNDPVLNRDNFTCQYCGAKATGYDHIIPTSKGGSDSENNKVACCIDCNRIKNDKDLVAFLNNNRERIDDELVLNNDLLKNYVTLCNVTNCYKVTDSNATDKNKKENRKEEDIEIYKSIISYLNDKTNSQYKHTTKKTKSLIDARLKEKFTVEDFKTVIDKKAKEWLKDIKMVQYLRPQTLFGTNFEGYLNQKEVQDVTRCNSEDRFANFKPKAPKTTDL